MKRPPEEGGLKVPAYALALQHSLRDVLLAKENGLLLSQRDASRSSTPARFRF